MKAVDKIQLDKIAQLCKSKMPTDYVSTCYDYTAFNESDELDMDEFLQLDRIYIDGEITFDLMEQIVDMLRESKTIKEE